MFLFYLFNIISGDLKELGLFSYHSQKILFFVFKGKNLLRVIHSTTQLKIPYTHSLCVLSCPMSGHDKARKLRESLFKAQKKWLEIIPIRPTTVY